MGRSSVGSRLRRRQVDPEAAAAALCRKADYRPAVAVGDVAHQGEAEAAAAAGLARGGGAIERLEDALALGGRDARAVIADVEDRAITLAPLLANDRQLDRPVAGVATRILQQVAHETAQQQPVALDHDRLAL